MEHIKVMNAQHAKTVYSYKNVKERLHFLYNKTN
jgi:hypothetical protein